MTTSEGLDSTFRLVTECNASRMALGCASDRMRKLRRGIARLITAPAAAVTAPVVGSVVAGVGGAIDWVLRIDPLFAPSPRLWLGRDPREPVVRALFALSSRA